MAWLSGWNKRQKLTLTGGSSGAQTDYQIKLTVAYDSGMQADFDDLRFTESDGTTLVDAWLETHTASTSAIVWVEFPTTPANTVTEDYYMYYGNAGVSSDWNGANTFLQYHGAATSDFLDALNVSYQNVAFEARIKPPVTSHNIVFGLSNSAIGADDRLAFQSYTGANLRYIYTGNEGTNSSKSETPSLVNGTYYRAKITNDGTNVYGYIDDNVIGTGAITTNLPNENLGLWLWTPTGTAEQEWSFARKFASGPATYVFGSEGWDNTLWTKRKKLTLTGGASGAQTDYQIKLTIPYDSDMKSDFSDLRFTTSTGAVLIDAWLEDHTTSTSATVWVEFPTTPANTITEDYYMYYGNSGATSDWDINDTFLFGADIDTPNYTWGNRWSDYTSDYISSPKSKKGYTPGSETGVSTINGVDLSELTTMPTSGVLELNFKDLGSTTMWLMLHCSLGKRIFAANDSTGRGFYRGDWATWSGATDLTVMTDGDWHKFTAIYTPTTTKIQVDSRTPVDLATTTTVGYPKVLGLTDTSSSVSNNYIMDNIFVRKYTVSPATYVFGSEETPGSTGSAIWYYRLLQVRRN